MPAADASRTLSLNPWSIPNPAIPMASDALSRRRCTTPELQRVTRSRIGLPGDSDTWCAAPMAWYGLVIGGTASAILVGVQTQSRRAGCRDRRPRAARMCQLKRACRFARRLDVFGDQGSVLVVYLSPRKSRSAQPPVASRAAIRPSAEIRLGPPH